MKKKGLQKLSKLDMKVTEILDLPIVIKADISTFNEKEKEYLSKVVNEKMKILKGEELDRFVEKISDIIAQDSKSSIWENNHRTIVMKISEYIDLTGSMPTMFELSDRTGLSRQTLGKHLKEYRKHPQFVEYLEQFRFMGQKILSKMFQLAMNGNVRAARLYLEMIGGGVVGSNFGMQTKNFIQIRNMKLTQEFITNLDTSDQMKIEEVLCEAINQNKNFCENSRNFVV